MTALSRLVMFGGPARARASPEPVATVLVLGTSPEDAKSAGRRRDLLVVFDPEKTGEGLVDTAAGPTGFGIVWSSVAKAGRPVRGMHGRIHERGTLFGLVQLAIGRLGYDFMYVIGSGEGRRTEIVHAGPTPPRRAPRLDAGDGTVPRLAYVGLAPCTIRRDGRGHAFTIYRNGGALWRVHPMRGLDGLSAPRYSVRLRCRRHSDFAVDERRTTHELPRHAAGTRSRAYE